MKPVDLHNITGISKAAISEYLSGNYEPKQKNTYKIASALNVKPGYLMGVEPASAPAPDITPKDEPHHKGVRIPVLGKVAAGISIEAVTDILDYEEIDPDLAKTGEFFALQVQGKSMEPTLREGDTVIVRRQPCVESGETAIVLVNGNDATVKQVKEMPAGIMLIGHNTAVYEPHFYSQQEIENLPVQILGKVVELRRKF
jgi:repressor LexA